MISWLVRHPWACWLLIVLLAVLVVLSNVFYIRWLRS